ncbi:MAG TPA: hypothetical protein VK811_09275 [Candidatus Acidoferrum sp.]|jgi:hypothetical protein|nr:hypothetical protein [Candidatus Acidoferrum sp.]
MNKKQNWLIAAFVILAALYVCFFTNWFKSKTIKIFDTSRQTMRQVRHHRGEDADLPYVLFGMEGKFKLTEIKVVSLASFQTNPNTPPLWHLISDSNSTPVQQFTYGQRIRGMKPAFAGAEPEDLETNVMYRLIVSAGKIKGQHDFEIQ